MSDPKYSPDLVETDETIRIPRKKNQAELKLDITPMIDVTFLLLIFFIVASNLDSDAVTDLPEAKNGINVTVDQAVVVTLTVGGKNGQALVYKGDGVIEDNLVKGDDIEVQEQEVAEYVSAALNGELPGESKKFHVMVKAEGAVTSGEVARIAKAANLLGDVEVKRINIGVKEAQ